MKHSDTITTATTTITSSTQMISHSPPFLSPQTPTQNRNQIQTQNENLTTPIVISPCAACKILKRKCLDKCVLAPYFPPTEPSKFIIAHRVFGASNIIKFLQELPESQRADAVSSMVYEASTRIRYPIYGCAGAIFQLQKQVNELQAQLAKAHAEIVTMQCQQANLVALIYMEMSQFQQVESLQQSLDSFMSSPQSNQTNLGFLEDNNNIGSLWESFGHNQHILT